ncbi:Gfo/Idh/MocA family protein [Candidatus Poribacteria bacterium]
MSIRIGICGTGAFAQSFIRLFHAHPLVEEVVLADLIPERVEATAKKFGITRTYTSLDDLCESDVDAIAILTQRQLHGPQVVQALKAGKHVYSAVPIGQTVEEVKAIVETVEKTNLIYMMGETSYYYPCSIYCRERFRKGDFGQAVYGEAQYFHDMSHFYEPFQRSGGKEWKQVAGIPPMHYPTHSVSMIVSVTGAHATSVSCLGYRDSHEDGIFQVGANLWDNVFSNEVALMEMSDGSSARISEFRRIGCVGKSSVLMSLYGTLGSYEENTISQAWATNNRQDLTDLSESLACGKVPVDSSRSDEDSRVLEEFYSGVSKVHPVKRLPREYAGLPNGHQGSHHFLADDFVKALATGTLPPNHAWAAARYCIPGLVAHQSAERNGERLAIPDLGEPPEHWRMLDPEKI